MDTQNKMVNNIPRISKISNNAPKAIKTKALMPTLREKKRYVAFRIQSEHKIANFHSVEKAIYHSFGRLFGEVGIAKAGLMFISERWNSEKQIGLVKIDHKHVNELKAGLALIKEIENNKVIVSSIGTSGILNKAVERYVAG